MLSLPHLIVIFIVALIVFGPEKLPELARNFGKVMAEFKRATGDLRAGFEEHMRELEREARVSETKKQQTAASSAAVQQASPALPESPAEPLVENKILPPAQESAHEQTSQTSSSPDQSNNEAMIHKADHGDS